MYINTSTGQLNAVSLSEDGTLLSNKYQPKGNYLTSHQDISGKFDKTGGVITGNTTIGTDNDHQLLKVYGSIDVESDGVTSPLYAYYDNNDAYLLEADVADSNGNGHLTIDVVGGTVVEGEQANISLPFKSGTVALTSDIPDISGKLDKQTKPGSSHTWLYAVQQESQTLLELSSSSIAGYTIPLRRSTGDIMVPNTPANSNDATSKKYVDDNKLDKTEASVASKVNTLVRRDGNHVVDIRVRTPKYNDEPANKGYVDTQVSGITSLGTGHTISGQKSFAIGDANTLTGSGTIAIGSLLEAKNQYEVSVGILNSSISNTSGKTIFTVGNGSPADFVRKNALSVWQDGRVSVQSAPVNDEDVVRLKDLNDNLPIKFDSFGNLQAEDGDLYLGRGFGFGIIEGAINLSEQSVTTKLEPGKITNTTNDDHVLSFPDKSGTFALSGDGYRLTITGSDLSATMDQIMLYLSDGTIVTKSGNAMVGSFDDVVAFRFSKAGYTSFNLEHKGSAPYYFVGLLFAHAEISSTKKCHEACYGNYGTTFFNWSTTDLQQVTFTLLGNVELNVLGYDY